MEELAVLFSFGFFMLVTVILLVFFMIFIRWIIGTKRIIQLLEDQNQYLRDMAEVMTRPDRKIT